MESRIAKGLLLIAVFSVVINSAQNVDAHEHLAPVDAPNLRPVASHSSHHHKASPAPRAVPPVSHVSFPPSGAADPPSPSVAEDEGSQDSPKSVPTAEADSQSDGDNSLSSLGSSELDFEVQSSFNFDLNMGSHGVILPKLPKIVHCDPKVKKICDATDDPSLCLSSVVPFLHGKTDRLSVLGVSIKVANNFAKLALTTLNRVSLAPGNPKKVTAVINDCKDSYEDVMYNLENAITALPSRDFSTLNSMLNGVISACGDCEVEFKSLHFPCPVTAIANQLIGMASNCLVISSSANFEVISTQT